MKTILTLVAALAACAALAQEPQMNLPRVKLSAGMHLIDAQLALDTDERSVGLMYRKEMPQHEVRQGAAGGLKQERLAPVDAVPVWLDHDVATTMGCGG